MKNPDRGQIAADFGAAVNMTTEELSEWLDTDTSKAVGWKGADGARAESVGHASGRRILSILQKSAAELTAEDYAHMRKVVGYVRRHLAQEPANTVSSRWRYSLMNWGHDPIKDFGLPADVRNGLESRQCAPGVAGEQFARKRAARKPPHGPSNSQSDRD